MCEKSPFTPPLTRGRRTSFLRSLRCKRDRASGFPDDKLRFHGNLRVRSERAMDEVEQALGCNSANLGKWLVNRCKARQGVRSRLDIVKANHRNIGRHTQVEVLKRADGTHRGDVVEGDQRGKRQPGVQQLLYDRIAQLRGSHVAVKADEV